jgi:hypothetical protein
METFTRVRDSLIYQKNALEILHVYLCSTHDFLLTGDFPKVESLENGIINIVTNTYEDRVEIRRVLKDRPILEYAAELPELLRERIFRLSAELDALEERCQAQAQRNKDTADMLEREHMERLEWMFRNIEESVDPERFFMGLKALCVNGEARIH